MPDVRYSLTRSSNVCSPATGKDHLPHNAFRVADSGFGDAEKNAGLPTHLPIFVKQFLDDTPLRADRDAVRDLQQQLDKAVDDFAFTGDAVEHEQRQADMFRVTTQLPYSFGSHTSPEALNQLWMVLLQNARRQLQATYDLKLTNFGEQAFQSNAPWVGLQTRES